jgi:8-oxo-dGTP pyrophosphatase MutT (NUDIX family)
MAEQLFQIGIKGLIRNMQGKVLLLKVPAWGDNPEHWDMPGGRMEPGEGFVQTLRRELQEEIGVDYAGSPRHLMTVLSTITIPVGDQKIPLVLMAYEVELPYDVEIVLDKDGAEQEFAWLQPSVAAERLQRKYPQEFCDMVATL